MNNKKFKVGDRVRIINSNSIEFCELNKVGTIVKTRDVYGDGSRFTYIVDMGRPRRPREPENTCWYLNENSIELVVKQNEQLVFNFMLD